MDSYTSSYSSPFANRRYAVSKAVQGQFTMNISGAVVEYSGSTRYCHGATPIEYQNCLLYSIFENLLLTGPVYLYTDWLGEDLPPPLLEFVDA